MVEPVVALPGYWRGPVVKPRRGRRRRGRWKTFLRSLKLHPIRDRKVIARVEAYLRDHPGASEMEVINWCNLPVELIQERNMKEWSKVEKTPPAVGTTELVRHLPAVLERIKTGRPLLVVRRGKPVGARETREDAGVGGLVNGPGWGSAPPGGRGSSSPGGVWKFCRFLNLWPKWRDFA